MTKQILLVLNLGFKNVLYSSEILLYDNNMLFIFGQTDIYCSINNIVNIVINSLEKVTNVVKIIIRHVFLNNVTARHHKYVSDNSILQKCYFL